MWAWMVGQGVLGVGGRSMRKVLFVTFCPSSDDFTCVSSILVYSLVRKDWLLDFIDMIIIY